MRRKAAAFVFCLALTLPTATALSAADHVVLRVLRVKTDNPEAYLKEVDKGRDLLKKLGVSANIRVWRARFAGESAGAIIVGIEYPSLASMAKDEATIEANSDYQAWFKGLDKLRTVESDSLYTELK